MDIEAAVQTHADVRARLDLAAVHGLLVRNGWGDVIFNLAARAFSLMKAFVRAAQIQLLMEATGAELMEIPPEVCERVAAQYEKQDRGRASAEWPAYLRQRDAVDPGYRT